MTDNPTRRVVSILSRKRRTPRHLAEPNITTQALEGIARLFNIDGPTGKHGAKQ